MRAMFYTFCCGLGRIVLLPVLQFGCILFEIFNFLLRCHPVNLLRDFISSSSHERNSVKSFFYLRFCLHSSRISLGVLISKILCPFFILTEL